MSTAGITVTGLNECVQMMEDAPGNIVALGYARATNAAMNVVAEAVISRTPVEHGDLAKALVINVKVAPPPSAKGGVAELGFGKQDHIAMWVEYGHAMVGHRPGKKDLGTTEFPPIETALVDGDVAFRQHSSGHTDGPNWPFFLDFAAKHMK